MKWAQRAEAVRIEPTVDELFQIERLERAVAVLVAGQPQIGLLLDRNTVGARVRLSDAVAVGMPIVVTFSDQAHQDQMVGFVGKCIAMAEQPGYIIGIEVDRFVRQLRA